jgi:serine/threonine protein kinase|tara:strand:- start:2181 stop:3176 length:996 start_codon:yes stop_codon:yes gene_type:complete
LRLDPGNSDAIAYQSAANRDEDDATPSNNGDSEPATPAPTAHDIPASFADGRYEVLGYLGEGAKKMVYLARDTLLDRDVAFALIKTDELDVESRARIGREAQAMGRLGAHANIVTVFDVGEHDGRPYLVKEFMAGGDVEGLIERAGNRGLPLKEAVVIAIAARRGLEFVHSNGIVHRDLKPGNVWLSADVVAKIGDFGLAMAIDRSRFTVEGMVVGTASYLPTEQAMGGDVTPKAGLYSLGAMLYDMVCGRPPFPGDDNIAIVGQHINTPPVSPMWHNSECPSALESIIMRLLEKDASKKPESASHVIQALESIEFGDTEQLADSQVETRV